MKFFENANYGRINGIIGIFVGILFIAFNIGTVYCNSAFYPKLLFVGIFLLVFSAALIIFPGGDTRKGDVPAGTHHLRFLWANAPWLHRGMRIVFAIAGAAAASGAIFYLKA